MTNFDLWQLRLREVTSPQAFIDMGFYYVIAAHVQRRVWTNANHQKLFPNIYPIMVGDPGIGKGLVVRPVLEMLKEHKMENVIAKASSEQLASMSTEQITAAAVEAEDFATQTNKLQPAFSRPKYKIPLGPDCVTFEALVESMAKQPRRINFKRWDEKAGKTVNDIYRHNSLAFCLEELSDLITGDKQLNQKVVKFLIRAYDCGDFEYVTKTKGEFFIKDCCMNFFGGTTPAFVEDVFSEGILNDGFASRAWFIYAGSNRFYKLRTPELDATQRAAQQKLSEHTLKLTKLYGYLPFASEAWHWLENWWEKEQCQPDYKRPNMSEKLNSYYSRKNIHVMKLAMILHLSENAETKEDGHTPAGEISLATAKQAMAVLDKLEETMHLALTFSGVNPLAKLGKKIAMFLKKQGPRTTDMLLLEFFADIPGADPVGSLNQTLTYLQSTGQIALDDVKMQWVKT